MESQPARITRDWTAADLTFAIVAAILIPIASCRTFDLSPSFTSLGMAGASFLFLFYFRGLRQLIAWISLTLVYSAAAHALWASSLSVWFLLVPMSGVAALSLIASNWALSRGNRRAEIEGMGVAVVAIFGFFYLCPFLLSALMRPVNTLHHTYDAVLLNWDHAMGWDVSFLLGRLVVGHGWLKWTCIGFYYGVSACIFVTLSNHIRSPWKFLLKTAVAPLLAAICYVLLPAAGPIFAFPDFPWTYPSAGTQFVDVSTSFPRNCVPSMHFAWAFLFFTNSKGWQRFIAAMFLFFTFLSTLGLGEHYAFDLILSLPLCALTEAVLDRRFYRCMISAALLVSPIAAARFMVLPTPGIAWIWAVMTTLLSIALCSDPPLLSQPQRVFAGMKAFGSNWGNDSRPKDTVPALQAYERQPAPEAPQEVSRF